MSGSLPGAGLTGACTWATGQAGAFVDDPAERTPSRRDPARAKHGACPEGTGGDRGKSSIHLAERPSSGAARQGVRLVQPKAKGPWM